MGAEKALYIPSLSLEEQCVLPEKDIRAKFLRNPALPKLFLRIQETLRLIRSILRESCSLSKNALGQSKSLSRKLFKPTGQHDKNIGYKQMRRKLDEDKPGIVMYYSFFVSSNSASLRTSG